MQSELNGEDEIQSESVSTDLTTTIEVQSQSELEEPQNPLEKATLGSMDTLNESASILLDIMKDSVNVNKEQRQDGVQKMDYSRAELAIQAANAIAKTIQTQVNIVKAVSDAGL